MSTPETTAPDVAGLIKEALSLAWVHDLAGRHKTRDCLKNMAGALSRLAPQEAAPVTVQDAAKALLASLSSHDADAAETLLWARAWKAMNSHRDDWYGLREALSALASGHRQEGGEG